MLAKAELVHSCLQVGRGQEFKPTMAGRLMKHEDFDPARVYPHMATGFGEVDEIALAERWADALVKCLRGHRIRMPML